MTNFNHRLRGMTKFGHLEVISDVERRGVTRKRFRWYYFVKVRCSCGVEKEVRVDCLHDGRATSCGHHRQEQHNRITGVIFAESRGVRGHG